MTQTAVDYRIYQRKNGYAQVRFEGSIPEEFAHFRAVYARVVREEDNLTVIFWSKCEKQDKTWQIDLQVPQGGLYRLEACAVELDDNNFEWSPRIKIVRHIGVGELFLLTGQSNMAGYGRDAAYDPSVLGVHLFGNNGKWDIAAHPLNDSTDTIYPENRELPSASSPALSFGREVMKRLGVPVGLIQASLGGSPLQAWHPLEEGTLYRAMLRRLDRVGEVGNVLWYQGCSDTDLQNAKPYCQRFGEMIRLWREKLGDVPVVTVQLNRHALEADLTLDRGWGLVREAQRQAARLYENVVVVPATDLSLTDGIHNSSGSNVILGERMARAYLGRFFGEPAFCAPDLEKAVKVDDTTIRLIFRDCREITPLEGNSSDFNAEDAAGLISCVSMTKESSNTLLVKTARPFGKGTVVHGFWRKSTSIYMPREMHGMPMLSFYGVSVE